VLYTFAGFAAAHFSAMALKKGIFPKLMVIKLLLSHFLFENGFSCIKK
jgi:hypothetical protein